MVSYGSLVKAMKETEDRERDGNSPHKKKRQKRETNECLVAFV